jgi:predicted porin
MQKKIIALAVAGLVSGGAFAQANVTVSGNIGVSYNSYSLSGATVNRVTYRQNLLSDESSAIILKGEENLGNGLTAWFQIDNRLTMDRGNGATNANATLGVQTSGLGNGNTAIGFKGNFGSIGFGRWDMHYDAFAPIGDVVTAGALASRIGYFGIMAQVQSGAASTQVGFGTRASNVIMYDTPTWKGFNARVAVSTAGGSGEGEAFTTGTNGDAGNGSTYQIRLNYNNGPINAVYSYFNNKVEGRGNYTAAWALTAAGAFTNTSTPNAAPNPADQVSNRLGGAYTFPMGVKVGLGWDRTTVKNNTAAGDFTRTAWMLPVSYTMGNHMFNFTYAKAGQATGTTAAGGSTDSNAKEYMLAYGYNFSKRTSVGMQYLNLKNNSAGIYSLHGASNANTGLTGPAAGEDSTLLSFNVRHFF